MKSQKQILLFHGLKYATLTLIGLVVVTAGIALINMTDADPNLEGRLLNAQERGNIPRANFTADRARVGFSAPADTHVIFTVPDGERIAVTTFFGGPEIDASARYWWYCFSGREAQNKRDNKRGRQLYDGKLGLSSAERAAQRPGPPSNTDLLGIYEKSQRYEAEPDPSEITVFTGGETCYLMSSAILPAGIDEDQDGLNQAFERNIGTDPKREDTDLDGIADGIEVFVVGTAPTIYDTDGDGLSDGFEDQNQDGLNNNETSPLLADTDRDGLCDGDGTGPGCPEPDSYPFRGEDLNQNGIVDDGETDPRKRDTDGDGIIDLDERWNELQSQQLGNRQ